MSGKRKSRLGQQAAEVFAAPSVVTPDEPAHPLRHLDQTAHLLKVEEILAGPDHALDQLDARVQELQGAPAAEQAAHPLNHLDQTVQTLQAEEANQPLDPAQPPGSALPLRQAEETQVVVELGVVKPGEVAHPLSQLDQTVQLIKAEKVLGGPKRPLRKLDRVAQEIKAEAVLAGPAHPLREVDLAAQSIKAQEVLAGSAHPLSQVDRTTEQLQDAEALCWQQSGSPEVECPAWLVWPMLAWTEAQMSWCRIMEPWFAR